MAHLLFLFFILSFRWIGQYFVKMKRKTLNANENLCHTSTKLEIKVDRVYGFHQKKQTNQTHTQKRRRKRERTRKNICVCVFVNVFWDLDNYHKTTQLHFCYFNAIKSAAVAVGWCVRVVRPFMFVEMWLVLKTIKIQNTFKTREMIKFID